MNKIYYTLLTVALSSLICSCTKKETEFTISGKIVNANDKVLYLEEIGTGNVLSLDSVKLDESGNYKFKHQGASYPMFYRLRLGNSFVPFAADSTDNIVINSDGNDFYHKYKIIEGKQSNKDIQQISFYRSKIDQKIDSILVLYTSGSIPGYLAKTNVDSLCGVLKEYLLKNYIYKNPKSPAAYYALFQRKGNAVYFSADDPDDERAFGAVATSYDNYYPNAPYTPFLKDIALKAVAQGRIRRELALRSMSDKLHINTVSFPNIHLKDQKGKQQDLSELAKNNTVLLSFTSYAAEWSPALVERLKKIHQRDRKLIIMDISADRDSYFWLNASHNLPWISVRDASGEALRAYNVQSLPTFFLVKSNELVRLSTPEESLSK